jgi:hypothetical protein
VNGAKGTSTLLEKSARVFIKNREVEIATEKSS